MPNYFRQRQKITKLEKINSTKGLGKYFNAHFITRRRMSFDTIQVFNPQAKDAFIEFLLGRINTFAQVCSENKWSEEQCWTSQDFDKLLEEYSVGSVVFPFSKAQLITLTGWLRSDSKGGLLKRYEDREIIGVLIQVKDGDSLKEYVSNLVRSLLRWDECPRGYSNGGEDREKDLTNTILLEILNRSGDAEGEDPPILDVDDGDDEVEVEEKQPEEPVLDDEETSLLENEGVGEAAEDDEVEEEVAEEEIQIEEVEEPPPPPKKKSAPPPAKKVAPPPKENFTPPKGIVLTKLVNTLMEYMQPAKAPSPNLVIEQRKKIVKYATERLGASESLPSFMKALIEQTIDVCDRASKGQYDIDSFVEEAVATYRNDTRNPK